MCCNCSQPVLALLGPPEVSDLSLQSGPKRTLTKVAATRHLRQVSLSALHYSVIEVKLKITVHVRQVIEPIGQDFG
jgi:hypothetical protein